MMMMVMIIITSERMIKYKIGRYKNIMITALSASSSISSSYHYFENLAPLFSISI